MAITEAMREEARGMLADPLVSKRVEEHRRLAEEIGWIAEQFDLGRPSGAVSWEEVVFASSPGTMRDEHRVVPLTAERIENRRRVAELTGKRYDFYGLEAVMREIILADCQRFYGADSREAHRAERSLSTARAIVS